MKKKIFLISLFVLMLTGCSDKFFEMYPSNQIVGNQFYKTAEDFNGALVACYERFRGLASYYNHTLEFRSDHLYIPAPTAGSQDLYDLDQFKDNAANGIISGHWNHLYNFIYRCNMVLQSIDNADFDTTLKNQYKGEALFMRSWCFFELCRGWGGVAMPLKVVSIEESLQLKRETVETMYDQIAEDLTSSIELLPQGYDSSKSGRVTKAAARAFLGRVHLFFGNFQETADVLAPIANPDMLLDNVADVFNVSEKGNKEVLLAIRYNNDIPSHGHGVWFGSTNPDLSENPPLSLKKMYGPEDKRLELLNYTQIGQGQYVLNKYYDELNETYKNVNNDYILLRYADVLLMYAEALNELSFDNSPASVALQMLNAVRTRSGIKALDASDVKDQQAMRENIWDERERELAYEGQRWFDLVRTDRVLKVMGDKGYTLTKTACLFPIPLSELDRIQNESLLWQNPGY